MPRRNVVSAVQGLFVRVELWGVVILVEGVRTLPRHLDVVQSRLQLLVEWGDTGSPGIIQKKYIIVELGEVNIHSLAID